MNSDESRPVRRPIWAAGALLAALIGVSCTSPSPTAEPTNSIPTSRLPVAATTPLPPGQTSPATSRPQTTNIPGLTGSTGSTGSTPQVVLDIAPADEALLNWAEQVLIRDCMTAAGFEYFVPDRATYIPDPADRAYTLLEQFPYDAATEGIPYAPRVRATSQGSDPNRDYIQSLSPSALAAYGEAAASGEMTSPVLGAQMPSQGCSADARRQLYGDLETFMVSAYTSNLTFITRFAAISDDRVVTAMADWRTCMAASGFTFESFDAARNAAAGSQAGQAAEIATADAACTIESGLGVVFRAAYNEHFNELIDENAELIRQYLAARVEAIKQATTLLAGS